LLCEENFSRRFVLLFSCPGASLLRCKSQRFVCNETRKSYKRDCLSEAVATLFRRSLARCWNRHGCDYSSNGITQSVGRAAGHLIAQLAVILRPGCEHHECREGDKFEKPSSGASHDYVSFCRGRLCANQQLSIGATSTCKRRLLQVLDNLYSHVSRHPNGNPRHGRRRIHQSSVCITFRHRNSLWTVRNHRDSW